MKKTFIALAILLGSVAVWASGAAESHGGGHQEIPLEQIGWQAANLGILLIAIFFLIKASVKETFANRKKNFLDQAEKTKASLKEAELALSGVKTKLATLESGEKSAVDKAQQEAAALKASLIKEAEHQAEKLKTDAQMVLGAELDKARAEIGELILKDAIATTTQKVSGKSAQITKDSETEFLKQISQVRA